MTDRTGGGERIRSCGVTTAGTRGEAGRLRVEYDAQVDVARLEVKGYSGPFTDQRPTPASDLPRTIRGDRDIARLRKALGGVAHDPVVQPPNGRESDPSYLSGGR